MLTLQHLREVAISSSALVGLLMAAVVMRWTPESVGIWFEDTMRRAQSRPIIWGENVAAGYYEDLLNARTGMAPERGAVRSPEAVHEVVPFVSYRYLPNLRSTGPQEGRLETNAAGLVDRNYPLPKPTFSRRIAIAGDSVVRGLSAPAGTSFETQFEEEINRKDGGGERFFEVLNFGVSGYRASQIFDTVLERVPKQQVDVCIFSLTDLAVFRAWADHLQSLVAKGEDLKYPFFREIAAAAGVRREDSRAEFQRKLAPHRLVLVRWMLRTANDRLASRSIRMVVALVPTTEDPEILRWRFYGIRELVKSEGIPIIDLLDTFRGVRNLESYRAMFRDLHPNPAGHRLIAENLYRKLHEDPALWRIFAGN